MSNSSDMKKTFYSTPNHPYEKRYGYYRAVRKGPFIAVAGTTPYDPETQKLLHPGDAGKQAAAIFTEIIKAIKAVGSKGAEDVIRVRMFLAVRSSQTLPSLLADIIVQNMEDIEAVGNAFSAVFAKDGGEMGVAMTAVITGFVDSDMLVEIEADAVVD